MSFYSEMQDIATDLLTEFDQGTIEYVKMTPGGGPADNPGEPTEVKTGVEGVVKGVSFKYIDGTNILSTDLQLTFAVKVGLVIDYKDYVDIDGTRLKIIKGFNIPPSGITVAQRLILRR